MKRLPGLQLGSYGEARFSRPHSIRLPDIYILPFSLFSLFFLYFPPLHDLLYQAIFQSTYLLMQTHLFTGSSLGFKYLACLVGCLSFLGNHVMMGMNVFPACCLIIFLCFRGSLGFTLFPL